MRYGYRYGTALPSDTAGNLFLADTYNNVIRLGQPLYALKAAAFAGRLVLPVRDSEQPWILML